ncbi:hypothetical protein LPJ63_000995 [Coemansia sp. RSA 2711]|nr:hypothetical protein LPJ63_000995 [Coemansia sp. RSA 2711]KAJ1845391.1 hypothetical protein LPJ70_002522 [Coemansia sp. RSA 2708]KAJ2299356.1 hypothetical protein IWW54_006498 [Coemansia sp. RSA 2705]KAJ2305651.1 hypothetical protein IWW52_006380 [Coemansia sp. RSA 2704]KAJ2362767.1 hypothetical protein H4S01_004628 [Coemansia sp. RSA 2610]KAJ2381906.1 hypothetical protein H4S02_005998 [Coemansia sp. RSA 2611]KAJ2711929.1 hypothetical protein H4R23_006267 [Coemansia sp. Cherry 401B]
MPGSQPAGKARRLVLTLEKGMTNCAAEATAYGKCVSANIETIGKHACHTQFQSFKACVQQALGRKW